MSGLSFPPLLETWKGAATGKKFPGSQHTWKKALAPRPLHQTPDQQTISEMQLATGSRFSLLQQSVQLPSEAVQRDNMMSLGSTRALGSSRGGMTSGGSGGGFPRRAAKMPLYNSVWPETTPPSFSVWDYCQKKGHAPPPNSLPAPRVTDMKSWFATYGHPTANAPPGVRSEFSATTRSVPFCEGEQSSQVKMHRGRVLR